MTSWQRQPSPSRASHFLRPSKEAPTHQKHNLQSNLISHICPFAFLISTPLTSLDTFKPESQAAHPSTRSIPITVRRGLSHGPCIVLSNSKGKRWERSGSGQAGQRCLESEEDFPAWSLPLLGTKRLLECLGSFCSAPMSEAIFNTTLPSRTQPRSLSHA